MRLLVAEDDKLLGEGICEGLKQNGYCADLKTNGIEVEKAILENSYDAVILDIGLPGKDGLSVLKSIRNLSNSVPVLILTAQDAIENRVKGLDAGADDYMTKPFDLSEITARVRALVRRAAGRSNPVIEYLDLTLDYAGHRVFKSGSPINLSRREFALLYQLLENVGSVVSKTTLYKKMYSSNEDLDSNALEVHIHNLRKKINGIEVKTIRGIGYYIENENLIK